MDSDDSRDDASSGSDSESNTKGPHSPSSVRSAASSSSKPQSPRGPRSPSPCGPRSPSPEGSIQSNSPPASPKQGNRSPIDDDRFNDSIKSPSAHSLSSQDDDHDRQSIKSGGEEQDHRASPKSDSSRSSSKSRNSIKSRSSGRRSPMSPKSPSSRKSSMSPKSPMSLKSPMSPKSPVSPRSRETNSPRHSVNSRHSADRRGPMSPPADDGNTSDSSVSSRGSSRKSVDRLKEQAEEISDGEMESEGKDSENETDSKPSEPKQKLNLSHEDLSDVSDLDSLGAASDDDDDANKTTSESVSPQKPPTDLRQKLDEAKNRKINDKQPNPPEKTSKTEDGEEQLDFEAEDGECVEEAKPKSSKEDGLIEQEEKPKEPPEEVEEGEVTDDDEVRPEETEPRPVCRFYSRGQCTWGASCRFLHPGVTDKGNYTMFELIRPMVPGGPGAFGPPDYTREERPPGYGAPPARGDVPVVESAWERGLRTAKEMMRKAIKRKEQDMDFEEKKMNLTLAQDELDKENGYYTRAASPLPVEPVPRHFVNVRHPAEYRPPPRVPEDYYGRRVVYEEPRAPRVEPPEYEVPRERVRSYRELPAHRMPDYYNDKYEEPISSSDKSRRTKREVIVQRSESGGRGDEWADPWMRSKSPGGRSKPARFAGGRRQSYSSASSYSSSSSSRSSSASSKSSYRGDSRSRSRSPNTRRSRRPVPKSPTSSRPRAPALSSTGPAHHRNVSPSVIVSEKKAANERALLMNPPAPSPKKAHKDNRPPSPGMMRTSAQNPPAPSSKSLTDQYGRTRSKRETDRKKLVVAAALAASVKSRARVSRSSSGSESSGSSSSDSESSYSTSSSSRDGSPTPRRKIPEKMDLAAIALKAKAMDVLKNSGDKRQLKMSLKTQLAKKAGLADLSELRKTDKVDPAQGKKRPAGSPPSGESVPKLAAASKAAANNKKSTSRREELLKQLKAVEDAIAKKRSKIN